MRRLKEGNSSESETASDAGEVTEGEENCSGGNGKSKAKGRANTEAKTGAGTRSNGVAENSAKGSANDATVSGSVRSKARPVQPPGGQAEVRILHLISQLSHVWKESCNSEI